MGPTSDAVQYFAKLGYPCPAETNPAEFLLDLVSIDTDDSPQVASRDDARIERLAVAFLDYSNTSRNVLLRTPSAIAKVGANDTNGGTVSKDEKYLISTRLSVSRTMNRFVKLLHRSWRQNIRNHQVNAVRLFVSAGNAYFFTNVFSSVKRGQMYTVKSVPDRTALLSFGVINMAMMTVMKTIDLFAKEMPVVLREQQRRQYTSCEYLISKTLAEIPLDAVFAVIFTMVLKASSGLRIGFIDLTATFCLMTVCGASLGFAIGASTPNAEVALSVGVPLMVLLLGVGVITPSGIDSGGNSEPPSLFVTALKQISPIAYAIRAVCIAEYSGMKFHEDEIRRGWMRPFLVVVRKSKAFFRMGGLALVKRGDEILQEMGLGDDTYRGSMLHLAVLSMLFLWIAWFGLMLQRGPPSKKAKR
jgi:hypothetical protein